MRVRATILFIIEGRYFVIQFAYGYQNKTEHQKKTNANIDSENMSRFINTAIYAQNNIVLRRHPAYLLYIPATIF